MATNAYNQKSDMVTNLDTIPEVINTAGEKAGNYAKRVLATVTPTAVELGSTTTVYSMVRLPSQCRVKRIVLMADRGLDTSTTTTFAVNVGAAYSDAPGQSPPVLDGSQLTNSSVVIDQACFATARLFGGTGGDGAAATRAANIIDLAPVNGANKWNVAGHNKTIWEMLGLATDPGGFIDITLQVQAAPTTTQTSAIALMVDFD